MPVTVTLSDEFADKLDLYGSQVSRIFELGLRELQARDEGEFAGVRGLLEELATLPSPREVLKLRPSPPLQQRIDALLVKNSSDGLSVDELREWDQYRELEHVVRLAKANALRRLQDAESV